MKYIFMICFFIFGSCLFLNAQTITKEQTEFLQILKETLSQKEVMDYLEKNDFFINNRLYVANNKTIMDGINHTLKLSSKRYIKLQSNEDMFFYAVQKHIQVESYKNENDSSEIKLILIPGTKLNADLKYDKGWKIINYNLNE